MTPRGSTTTEVATAFNMDAIGREGTAHRYEVTDAALERFAAATDDAPGGVVFAIVPVWPALAPASRAVAAEEIRPFVVHYEQDIVIHQPLVAGMTVLSRATPSAILPRPNGTSVVIRLETRDEAGELLNEQYVTEFFRGVEAPESVGERAPDHRLEAPDATCAEVVHEVADDQTIRYAEASGDDFAIHLDDAFARSVGLPGRIVHGLCTMAFAGRAVLEVAGVRNPRAMRRLAVRFSAPLFPGESLHTRVWPIGDRFGFECVNGAGSPVIKDGRADLR